MTSPFPQRKLQRTVGEQHLLTEKVVSFILLNKRLTHLLNIFVRICNKGTVFFNTENILKVFYVSFRTSFIVLLDT